MAIQNKISRYKTRNILGKIKEENENEKISFNPDFSYIRIGLVVYTSLYAELMEKFLESVGFTVVFTETDVLNTTTFQGVDIIILDPPEVNPGIKIIDTIKARFPNVRTIIYTGANGRFFEDLNTRVDYYIYNTKLSSLIEGIFKVFSRDEAYIKNSLEILKEKFKLDKHKGNGDLKFKLKNNAVLTDQEMKYIETVRKGKIYSEDIAKDLCVSVSTLKTIQRKLCAKLGIDNNKGTLLQYMTSISQN